MQRVVEKFKAKGCYQKKKKKVPEMSISQIFHQQFYFLTKYRVSEMVKRNIVSKRKPFYMRWWFTKRVKQKIIIL